jgi:tetratricopeptide (TPR) repeat protein
MILAIVVVLALSSGGGTPAAGVEPTRAAAGAVGTVAAPPAAANATAQPASPSVQALIDQAYNQLTAGDSSAARATMAQAFQLEPDNPHVRVARAIAEIYDGGDLQQAASDLEFAAPTMAGDPVYHLASGLLHRRSEKHYDAQAADKDLTQAIEACGDNKPLCAAAYDERGRVRAWDLGDPQGALQDFERVTQLSTNSVQQADVYSFQADIYFSTLGDVSKGIELAQQAYQLNNWPGYLEYAAKYAVKADEYDRALELYAQLLKDQNGDPRLLAGRAYVELSAGETDTAMKSAERALQLQPGLLEAHYVKALVLLNSDEGEKALAELQAIQEAANKNPDAAATASEPFLNGDFGHELYFDLAQAAYAAGDATAALDYLAHTIQEYEYWPYSYALKGQILVEQGNLAGAREAYLKALDNAGEDEDLRTALQETLAGLAQ